MRKLAGSLGTGPATLYWHVRDRDELLALILDDVCRAVEVPSEGAWDTFTDEQVKRLAALGSAISDPIRVRMLGMMAAGRECCPVPESGVPEEDRDAGLCVCEFENYFGMGQSKVSYHMKKLKDAGLVREEKRGRWHYYSVDGAAVEGLLADARGFLMEGTGCC